MMLLKILHARSLLSFPCFSECEWSETPEGLGSSAVRGEVPLCPPAADREHKCLSILLNSNEFTGVNFLPTDPFPLLL